MKLIAAILSPLIFVLCGLGLVYRCHVSSLLIAPSDLFKNIEHNSQGYETHFLVRNLTLRGVGLLYLIVFLTAYIQFDGCWSDNGILPVKNYIKTLDNHRIRREQHWFGALMLDTPNILWFLQPIDPQYNYAASLLKYSLLFGIISSLLLLIGITNHFCLLFLMWFINVSLVSIGQRFMGYGWHTQFLQF